MSSQQQPDKPNPSIPTGETPNSTTYTYVTGVELIKFDGDTDARLTGAVFEITGNKVNTVLVRKDVYTLTNENNENVEYYYALKDGSYTKEAPKEETEENKEFNDKYDSLTNKYVKNVETEVVKTSKNVKAQATVGADGVLRFEGLGAGKFEIKEITAPSGYNKLKDTLKINITWTAPEEIKENAANCTWNVSGENVEVKDGIITLSVANKAGALLPSTGGIGTTIFYAAGIILMAGAVFFVVRRKRA